MGNTPTLRPFALVAALLAGPVVTTAFLPIVTLHRWPVEPAGYTPPPTPRCVRLDYTGRTDPQLPSVVRLTPERVSAHDAHAWFAAASLGDERSWRQPLWWQPVGADSIDIVFHHYPIIRVPAGLSGRGRIEDGEALSFVAILAISQSPSVWSTPMVCP